MSIEPVPRRPGRPALFGRSLPGWVKWRRWRERKTGFSDPLLVQMGLSALPDASPKPRKPRKPPEPPKPSELPKQPRKPPEPFKSPETGSGAWAASLSWASSIS